jgi:ribosomal protein S18 acetylase RimI-like enzyme
VTPALVAAFARLMPQLMAAPRPVTPEALEEIVGSPATTLLVARDEVGEICGAATVVVFRIPDGVRARLESVVVDQQARGRGVGEALCRAAIERARAGGAQKLDLSSSPAREAANRLYQRLGFELRTTNVYRLEL